MIERLVEAKLVPDLRDLFRCGAVGSDDHRPDIPWCDAPSKEEDNDRDDEEDSNKR